MRTKSPLQADKILDAAAQLFGTQRFHEVRMEDIAAEAEVGKGTLYRYFRDKEELYLALLTRASKQFHDRLEAVVRQGEEPRRRLVNVVAAILAFFDEQPHLFDLIQRAEVMRGADFPWRQTRDELVRLVVGLFDEAKARGIFVVQDAELSTLMLLGGLRNVLRFSKQPRPADLSERIINDFLQGAARGAERIERG